MTWGYFIRRSAGGFSPPVTPDWTIDSVNIELPQIFTTEYSYMVVVPITLAAGDCTHTEELMSFVVEVNPIDTRDVSATVDTDYVNAIDTSSNEEELELTIDMIAFEDTSKQYGDITTTYEAEFTAEQESVDEAPFILEEDSVNVYSSSANNSSVSESVISATTVTTEYKFNGVWVQISSYTAPATTLETVTQTFSPENVVIVNYVESRDGNPTQSASYEAEVT